MKLIPYSEIKKQFTPEQERKIAAETRKMEAETLLVGLWQHTGQPQRALAAALGVKHPTLRRAKEFDLIEVNRLQRILESLGGKLKFVATVPGGNELLLEPATKRPFFPPHIAKEFDATRRRKTRKPMTSKAASPLPPRR